MRAMHAQLSRRLKELDMKEDRLMDLAADGTLPQDKIKARLRKIDAERAPAASPQRPSASAIRRRVVGRNQTSRRQPASIRSSVRVRHLWWS